MAIRDTLGAVVVSLGILAFVVLVALFIHGTGPFENENRGQSYAADCENSSDYDCQNLDAQVRMAEAAERQSLSLLWQVFLLACTLGVATAAAKYAKDAANATVRIERTENSMLDSQLKMLHSQQSGQSAWIGLRHIDTKEIDDRTYFTAVLNNSGSTPATDVCIRSSCEIAKPGTQFWIDESSEPVPYGAAGPNREFLLSYKNPLFGMDTDGWTGYTAIIFGLITYSDIHKNPRATAFHYEYRVGTSDEVKFHPTGPNNYMK